MKKLLLTMIGALLAFAANAADWYMSGAFDGWSGHCKAAYKFTEESAGVYKLTLPESKPLSGEFLIVQGTVGKPNWDTKIGTNGTKVQEGVPYSYRAGAENFNIATEVKPATITLDTNKKTILVTGPAVENEYSTVYIVGDLGGGWNDSRTDYPLALKSGTQNVWEGSFNLTGANNYFKLRAGNFQYGTGLQSDIEVELGKEYTASQSGSSFVLAAGKYNFSFVLDKNADTGKLTVTQDGPVTYPETLYVVGNVKNSEFAPNVTEPLPATAEAGHYEGDVTFTGTLGTGFSYFSLATATGTTATDWDGLGTRYGAAEENLEIGTEPVALTGNKDWGWKLADGTYTVSVNLVDKTMTVVKKEGPTPPTPVQPLEVTFDFTSIDAMKDFIPTIVPAAEDAGDWIVDSSAKSNFKWPMNPVDLTHDGVNLYYNQSSAQANMSNVGCVYYIANSSAYDFRVYKTNQMTLTAPEGYAISEITFTTAHIKINVSMPSDAAGTLGAYASKKRTWKADEGLPQEKVVFNIDETVRMNTIKVTLVKKEAPQPTYPELYFRGAQNDNAADEASLFTRTDGVYTLTLAKLNGNFKIADAEWGVQFSTKNTAMALGTEYAVEDAAGMGGDMAIEGAAKDVTITFDYTTMKLKVEGTAYTPEVGYQINSNLTVTTWSKADMTKTAEGKWEYVVIPAVAAGEIQVIRTEDGTPKDYLGSAAEEISEANPSVTMGAGLANLKFALTADSEYKFTFDPETSTLTVAPTAEPITHPVLYFRGGNTSWEITDETNKMTETDGVYTFTLDKLNAEFKIAAEDWDEASFSTKNLAMELDTEYDVTSVIMQDNSNMSMAKNIINATVTFDYKAMKLKVEGTVDDTPAVITYIIKGSFTEPAWDTKDMVKSDVDDTWSYTGVLAAEAGDVLVVQLNDGVEKVWFKAPATEVLSAAKPEITVAADGEGNPKYDFTGLDVKEITFTFNPATGALKASWTTGIEGISADFDPTAEYYNLQGLRVNTPATGLYIVVRGNNVTKEYLK